METLQLYWWAVVSLLGALLVFLLFVQGGQSLIYTIAKEESHRLKLIALLGHKWEITYTTLVTFGGAAFASFPLFYSTSFGGAYWLWISILLLFVIQAVSYEFRNKQNNFLGKRIYDFFLFLNGSLGTVLLGVAVGTLFTGGAYIMDKLSIIQVDSPTVSSWTNSWHGLEAIANPFNLLLGLVVLFAARTLGLLYTGTYISELKAKCHKLLKVTAPAFVLLFVAFVVALALRTGYTCNPQSGVIEAVKYKYLLNYLELVWPLVLLLVGVVLVLLGIGSALFCKKESCFISKNTFYVTGAGVVLAVWSILIVAAFNNTVYFPSTVALQESLTLAKSSSSHFTLKTMAYASIAVPFVVAYIAVVWKKMTDKR